MKTDWNALYRIAAAAAGLTLLTIPAQVAVFAISPPPEGIDAWLALFESSPVLGLLNLDLLYISTQILIVIVLLAIYIAVRDEDPSLSAVALTVGVVGITVHIVSNPSLDMLWLSQSYAAAGTDAERELLRAVGESLLIQWEGTAYTLGYIFGGLAIGLFGLVMLRGSTFSRLTGIAGVLLALFWLVPPSFGTIGLIFSLVSLPLVMLWLGSLAGRFIKLANAAAA